MTLPASKIIKFVRTRLREPDVTDSHFSDDPDNERPSLVELINDVRAEVCERIPYYRQARQIVGDGNIHPLPDDLLRIEYLASNSGNVPFLTLDDTAGTPTGIIEEAVPVGYGALIRGDNIITKLTGGGRLTIHYVGVEPEILTAESDLLAPSSLRDVYGYAVLKEAYAGLKNTFWSEWYEVKFEKHALRRRRSEMDRQYPGPHALRRPR